jgi:hypothetical protein
MSTGGQIDRVPRMSHVVQDEEEGTSKLGYPGRAWGILGVGGLDCLMTTPLSPESENHISSGERNSQASQLRYVNQKP